MPRTSSRSILPGLLLLVALPVHPGAWGGWATITLEDLPDYVVAEQPVPLTFTVRQHGNNLLRGLRPRVEAEAAGLETGAAATATGAGQYTATLTLPQAGEWTVTIHSGFGKSRATLLPLRAIDAGTLAPRAVPESERGRRLFVAKGCVTCHLHREVGGRNESIAVGPELTGRRFAADYLKLFLANPAIKASGRNGERPMPNLNLKPLEIAALAAFITAERQAFR